jgi:hypothetical protein
MRLFYVDTVKWTENHGVEATPKEVVGLKLGRKIHPQKLYIATEFEIEFIVKASKKFGNASDIKVLTSQVVQNLLKKSGFPIALGNPLLEKDHHSFEDLLANKSIKDPIKLGVISPFGYNLGDSLMFFTIVGQYRKLAAGQGRTLEVHLMNAVLPERIGPTYKTSPLFTSVQEFPCDINFLSKLDAYINFTRPHLHYDIPWVDSLLELSGIQPETIPDESKRNTFKLDEAVSAKLDEFWESFKSGKTSPFIIFHRESSTPIRTMPEDIYIKLLKEFLDSTDYHFISLTPVNFTHPRFTDLSYISFQGFNCYVKLISLVDGFIAVDTSLYHFADAFDVPGVVIYTCQPPERFSKYYPFVKGFQIEGGENLGLKHWSNDPVDIEYADGLWSLLDSKMLINLLGEVQTEKLLKEEI